MTNLLQIELTEQEANVLLQLINAAVQARGLDAAQAGFHFQQKINSALAASKTAAELDLEIADLTQPIKD